ncbi:MAG: cell division protein FtsQ/DivIB [Minisyncoccia bacterium]
MEDIATPKKVDTTVVKKSTPDLIYSSRGKFAKERRRKFKFWATVWSVVFVLFLVGVVFVLRLDSIRVHSITVSETKVIDSTLVKDHANAHISGMYAWVIPKNSVFLLPLDKIQADIVHNFPYAKTVNVRRVGIDSIVVDITERKGLYLWCTDVANTECYFMDNDGYVFSLAPYFSGEVYIRFYGERTTNTNGTGNYQTVEKMQNITDLFSMLVKRNLVPVSINVTNEKNTITIKKSENYIDVLLPLNFTAVDVDRTLGTLLTNVDFTNNIEKLSKIDLRFGNKIFYTYKNNKTDEVVGSETGTEVKENIKKQN